MLICINGHQNLPITAQSVASGVRMIEFCHECGVRVTEACPVCKGLHPLNAAVCPIAQISIQRFKEAKNDAHERLRLFLGSSWARDIYKERRRRQKKDVLNAVGLFLLLSLSMFGAIGWDDALFLIPALLSALGWFVYFMRAAFARDNYETTIRKVWQEKNQETLDTTFQHDLPWSAFIITDKTIQILLKTTEPIV